MIDANQERKESQGPQEPENDRSPRPRRTRLWWAFAAAAVLLIGAAVVWGVLANSQREAGAGSDVPPQVTDLPTPTPGETEPVEKDGEPVEVAMDERAEPVENVFVELVSIEAVTAGKGIPGEPEGPAVRVELRVVNESGAPLDTAGAGVNLSYGGEDRTPAVSLTDEQTVELPAEVAAGTDVSAIYVFALPEDAAGDLGVSVELLASGPDVIFAGPRPKG